MTLELLRAFTKAGNYVGGAFDGGRLVGACVGFFHAPAEDALHSHIAGVAPGLTGRNVGFALKLHQRAWALLRGVSEIAWTFDPLVSRNAYFNLVKLGAPAGRVPPELLRPDARHHQRRTTTPTGCWCAGGCATPRSCAACAGASASAAGSRRARRRRHRRARRRRRTARRCRADLDGATVAGRRTPRHRRAARSATRRWPQRWRVAVREALTALVGRRRPDRRVRPRRLVRRAGGDR